MPAVITKWQSPGISPTSYLTTELNSLANAGMKLGAAINPSEAMLVNFELTLNTQGSARSSGARVDFYIIESLDDGTTYQYGSDSLAPSAHCFVGSIIFDAATTARVGVLMGVPINPGRQKVMVVNNTGQAFASSGNVLKYSLHSYSSE